MTQPGDDALPGLEDTFAAGDEQHPPRADVERALRRAEAADRAEHPSSVAHEQAGDATAARTAGSGMPPSTGGNELAAEDERLLD